MTTRLNTIGLPMFTGSAQLGPAKKDQWKGAYQNFLRGLIKDLCGRVASEEEVAEGTAQLLDGGALQDIALQILSTEERKREWVTALYTKLLAKPPSEEAVVYWLHIFTSRGNPEELIAGLLGSDEYFAKNGQSHEGFIRALLWDLLQRCPSSAEVDSWVGLLNSQSASRLSVALHFTSSDECRVQQVRGWFWRYLHREPNPLERDRTAAQISHGIPHEEVLAQLLSSQEYFRRKIF